MLISRDSINYQLFITFHNFLRSELSEIQYPFHGVGFEPVCKDVLGGEGFNLAWVCSPLLNTTEVTHYIEEWKIEIIFMNRGAWFRSDSSFFNELKEIAKVLQMRYPHLLVFYRNSFPGIHLQPSTHLHARISSACFGSLLTSLLVLEQVTRVA